MTSPDRARPLSETTPLTAEARERLTLLLGWLKWEDAVVVANLLTERDEMEKRLAATEAAFDAVKFSAEVHRDALTECDKECAELRARLAALPRSPEGTPSEEPATHRLRQQTIRAAQYRGELTGILAEGRLSPSGAYFFRSTQVITGEWVALDGDGDFTVYSDARFRHLYEPVAAAPEGTAPEVEAEPCAWMVITPNEEHNRLCWEEMEADEHVTMLVDNEYFADSDIEIIPLHASRPLPAAPDTSTTTETNE